MITLEEAQAAKSKLQSMLRPEAAMVGITKVGEDYAVCLGLYDYPDLAHFPETIDAVPIVVKFVGEIKPL